MIVKIVFIALMLAICGYAFWKGHGDERWTALAIIVATLASGLTPVSGFAQVEFGVMAIDIGLLVFLIIVALRSDRFWPLWAAGFQVVGTTIHAASMNDTDIIPHVYAAAQSFWAYPVMAALMVGTWLEARYRDA